MSETTAQTATPPVDRKFEFVKHLAADLSAGNIELPSFPDVVIRVRQALENEDSSTQDLVKIISAEPVLAARLLTLANSAALKPGGDSITDLNMAVNRIGRSLIRSTAMAFALAQLRSAQKLDSVREHLETLWQRSAHVAALSYVLTKRYTKLNADEALFIGLMHGIGEMYIVVRADSHPILFSDKQTMGEIIEKWSAPIGSSILESWGFADHVCSAVGQFQEADREHEGDIDFADILILAYLLHRFVTADEDGDVSLEHVSAWHRLEIEMTDLIGVLQKSDEQIRSLRHALGK
ncbi:MAG: HDOD domain-containing protein [Gammaproteobacteria bacterium]|nr:HDOD domain-containing protein [Gammaproteobacteria bacterium]